MNNDPNQPQQPPPYYGQPQSPYEQPPWGQQPPPYYGQPQQPTYEQPPWGQQPPPQYAPTQYGTPYGAPPVPGYAQPQPPRRSRRALWITLGILGGLLLLSCIVCGIFFAFGIGFFARTVGAPVNVVDQYYNAIKSQRYDTAYSYLDPNLTATNGQPLTQQVYANAAQAQDTDKGIVSSFSVGSISVNNDTASMTVTVKRANAPSYDVHLQLRQESGTWKITSYDSI
jgi:Protein of unknown function (DUF3828)